jgi:PTS system beta-glucosides-specific IIC component
MRKINFPSKHKEAHSVFNKLKDKLKKEKSLKIFAPMDGEVVPISQVNDPAFSEELLGKGVAIRPSGNKVSSPVNGTISLMFDTGHAVSLTSDDGIELLIHIGLDTVKLKGKHYNQHVNNGDKVKVGDLLITFDPAGISGAGYDTITPVIVCNPDDYKKFDMQTGRSVAVGEEIIILEK